MESAIDMIGSIVDEEAAAVQRLLRLLRLLSEAGVTQMRLHAVAIGNKDEEYRGRAWRVLDKAMDRTNRRLHTYLRERFFLLSVTTTDIMLRAREEKQRAPQSDADTIADTVIAAYNLAYVGDHSLTWVYSAVDRALRNLEAGR